MRFLNSSDFPLYEKVNCWQFLLLKQVKSYSKQITSDAALVLRLRYYSSGVVEKNLGFSKMERVK